MDLVEKAFRDLYPYVEYTFEGRIRYSAKFNSLNANVTLSSTKLTFSLSRDWEEVDEDIKIGLLQDLLLRLFKKRKWKTNRSMYHDLYNSYIKNIPKFSQVTEVHPVLEASFQRMNNKFFFDQLSQPNLVVGSASYRKLGSYDFHTDTISVSKLLLERPDLLDYVMYHEMLHKHLQFDCSNGRTMHHTHEFKKHEKLYPNAAQLEKDLGKLGKKKKRSLFGFF